MLDVGVRKRCETYDNDVRLQPTTYNDMQSILYCTYDRLTDCQSVQIFLTEVRKLTVKLVVFANGERHSSTVLHVVKAEMK